MKSLLLIVLSASFSLTLFAANPERGKTIAVGCKGCHGESGIATQPMHPNLAGQKERYLMWQLDSFRSGKRPSHIMNEMAKNLTDEDIADLSAYYSALSSCN